MTAGLMDKAIMGLNTVIIHEYKSLTPIIVYKNCKLSNKLKQISENEKNHKSKEL